MTDLNHEAIASQRLAPDVPVTNKHDPLHRRWVISSITEDGTVFFGEGTGPRHGLEASSGLTTLPPPKGSIYCGSCASPGRLGSRIRRILARGSKSSWNLRGCRKEQISPETRSTCGRARRRASTSLPYRVATRSPGYHI
jgi:hypothetical protein